jgi:hypothetical protein
LVGDGRRRRIRFRRRSGIREGEFAVRSNWSFGNFVRGFDIFLPTQKEKKKKISSH